MISDGWLDHSHGKRRFNGRIGANLLILALAAVGRSCARWRSGRQHGAVQAHRERFRSASSCRRIQLSSALKELVGVRPGRARKRMSTTDSNVRFGPPGQFVRAWHSDGADCAAIERSASTSLRWAALAVEGAGPAAMLRGERRCRRWPQHRRPSHGEHRLLELAPAMKEERGFGRLFWQASCLLDTVAGGLPLPHLRAFPVETGRLLASFFFSGAL